MVITIATMALGVAIFNTGFNVRQSLVVFLDDTKKAMKYDVQVAFKDPVPMKNALRQFSSVANLKRIEEWSGGKGRLQSGKIPTTNTTNLLFSYLLLFQ